MFKLAELFVDIKARDQQFKGQLQETKGSLTTWGVAVGTAVGALTAQAIAGAASAIAGFFAAGVKGAVDLQETMSKVDAIFGGAAGIITAEADAMASRFGVVKQEYLDAASGFGAAFKSAGMSAADAAAMGNKLTKLGMDMASFGNASNADVFTAISAALRGENDPIERFGVRLSAAKIEAEALRAGLARNKDSISDLAKAQASLNLILRDTADQQGDLERTADGSANQWRRLTGTFTNMAVELGGKLEPALNGVLKAGNAMIDGIAPGVEWLGGVFQAFSDTVSEVVEVVGIVWRNLGDYWEMTAIRAREMFGNLIAGLSTLPDNFGRVAEWIGRNWYQVLADGFNATGAIFTNFTGNVASFVSSIGSKFGALAEAIGKFLTDPFSGFDFDFGSMLDEFEWTPLLDGFEATMEQLPELMAPAWLDLSDQIDAVGRRVEDREGERAARMAARIKAAAKPDAAKADDDGKFKAQRLDASDYAFKLSASLLNGGDDTAKKQLAAAEKTAKATADTAEAVKKPRPAIVG